MTSLTRKQRRQEERQHAKLVRKMNKLSSGFNINHLENNMKIGPSKDRGLNSISDVITGWAEPLYDRDWDQEGIYNLHDLVCCCWNIGSCSEEHSDALWEILIQYKLDEYFNDPDGILANKLKQIIAQRRSQFSDDRRFIMDFSLKFTQDNRMNLQTASSPVSEEHFLAMQAAKIFSITEETFEA